MQWEALTAPDFTRAVQETGVCILSLGVLEKHSEHLPLGTDMLLGHKVACMAAEIEPAVVFPQFYFGQIYEARAFPGALTLKPTLLVDLLWGVLDEIGRNGFKKIVLFNAHGGNHHWLRFVLQSALWEEKPYQVYLAEQWFNQEDEAEWAKLRQTDYGGHACEQETSEVLGCYPEWVKMDMVPENPAKPLDRLQHLPPTYNALWWYANYPDHYAGDARTASIEKGKELLDLAARRLAVYVAAVKADTVIPALSQEFFNRSRSF
jgi:creatinine amidohydrolase